jgi:ADP-heptose:LPS heptosyltransferase
MLVSLVVKFFSKINLISGLFLNKKRKIDPGEIKTILVNRTDRLGDAIVSLPLLLELHKRFVVTVLTSKYNDSILKEFLKTEVFLESPASFWDSLKMIFVNFFCLLRLKKKAGVPQYDLYLDLMGIRGLDTFLKIKEKNLCRYYVDFNLGIGNLFLDYADNKNPALFARQNLVDSCRRLLKESLQLDLDVPDYLDLTSRLTRPDNFNVSAPYVLLNISGFNKFRGPSAEMYALIINEIDFPVTFLIMDDEDNPNITDFKRCIKKNNIFYLEDNYSLWQLLSIARLSVLYVGSDSGISQFLGAVTHCVIFFGTGEHMVWRPYSRNPYKKNNANGLVIEESMNSANHIKKIIYVPVRCRPCFDFGCIGYRCIRGMDIEVLAREITQTLQVITGSPKKIPKKIDVE